MKEAVLKSLMRLFAIVSQVHSIFELETARKVVEDYLRLVIRQDKVKQYLIMYDFYHNEMRERENKTGEKQLSLFSVKAMIICEEGNKHLTIKQKIFVLTHILEILSVTQCRNIEDIDFVKTIATAFKIDESLFNDCLAFVLGNFNEVHNSKNILFISNKCPNAEYRYILKDYLIGDVVFLYIESVKICLFKHRLDKVQVYLNSNIINRGVTYVFEKGAELVSPMLGSIYFNDINRAFLHDERIEKIHFVAQRVNYKLPNSNFGISTFDFNEESGQLIGIMGGSGVGKSTLLNLLNGNIIPNEGDVFLNGYNVHKEKDKIHGLIGFVPQDDLLIEELTVFQNLYLNARLCFKNYSKERILRKVNKLLYSLDLDPIKHLQVGNPLKKIISGGQRKRVNIALELIREPYVLFVDEPTSGLSSTDSKKVMELLKHQSLKGRLVIVNIHQPSSDVFLEFDRLIIIDEGGKFVYHGVPNAAFSYFNKQNQLTNADESGCPTCGNQNPDQILQTLELKKVNEFGAYTRERQTNADEWYASYYKGLNLEIEPFKEIKRDLPKIDFKVPSAISQFRIFSIRNILTKIRDRQFMLINIFEAPLLAFILGWFTKYNAGTTEDPMKYVFSENSNIPVYIFMGIVVSIFLGLMLSAEDIIRDGKLLKREEFLNLNKLSYFNSKILFVSIVLAVQLFLFVLIGNTILDLKGMMFHYWLVFWMSSMVAGIVGLNVSATMQSVVSIYILIPILLVPQILLGGALIRFDKLNKRLTSSHYVPIAGDIMPSRWAYEALMVHQYSNNKYQKPIYEYEREEANTSFKLNYYLPEVQNQLNDIRRIATSTKQKKELTNKIELINIEIEKLSLDVPDCFESVDHLAPEYFNVSSYSKVNNALQCAKDYYIRRLAAAIRVKDERIMELANMLGGNNELLELKDHYYNEGVARIVLNKDDRQKIEQTSMGLVRKSEPIYYYPEANWGRAHLFAPVKRIWDYYLETYWFNTLMLFLIALMFYITLIFEVFPRLYTLLNFKKIKLVFMNLTFRLFNVWKPIVNSR